VPYGESIKVRVRPAAAKVLSSVMVVPTRHGGGRDKHGQFRKGVSGQTITKQEKQFDLAELARVHAPQAIQVLVEVMGDKKAPPPARTAAASALLDRGYGRPAMKVETSGGEDLRQMHLDALKAVAHAAATGGAMGAMAGAAQAVGAAAYFAERQQQIAVQAAVIEVEAEVPKPGPLALTLKRKRKRKPPPKAVGVARAAKARAGKAAKKAAAEASKMAASANKGEGEAINGNGIPDSQGQRADLDVSNPLPHEDSEAEVEGQEVEL
jgi:hypothetical protein